MKHRLALLAFFSLAVVVAACEESSRRGGSDDDDDDGLPPTQTSTSTVTDTGGTGTGTDTSSTGTGTDTGAMGDGFTLQVTSVLKTPFFQNYQADVDRVFAVLDITLSNQTATPALQASYSYYTVTTSASLTVASHSASGSASPVCASDISVSSGGSFVCQIVFEIPDDQNPILLNYADDAMHTVSAPVPAPEVPECVPISTLTQACGQCADMSGCFVNLFDCKQSYFCTTESPGCDGDCTCEVGCFSSDTGCLEFYDEIQSCMSANCPLDCF